MKKQTWTKAIALILSLGMAFGLMACGNGGTTTAETTEAAAAVEEQTGADSSEETAAWTPTQTINIIVPFSAGGDTDFNAREYANYLSDILGVSVIVTNVEGGSGSIGSQQVKDSNADGYTVLFHTTTFLFNYYAGVTDYGLDDFEFSCVAGKSAGWCLAVKSDCEWETLEEMVEASKETNITLASGSGDVTSSANCIGVQLNAAGAEFRTVEYGGASDKVTGLLGGEIDAIIVPLVTAAPYVESGDFKIICCFEEERSTYFQDVPTAVESGYDVVNPNYYLMMFPEGTPEEVVETFTDACEQVYNMSDYQADLVDSFSQAPYFLRGDEARENLDEFCEMIQEVRATVAE